MKIISRQVKWLNKHRMARICTSCKLPSDGHTFCVDCARRINNVKKPHPLPSAWAAVDWSQPHCETAARLGVSRQAVWLQRKRKKKT